MIRLTALLAAVSLSVSGCDAPVNPTFVQPNPKGTSTQPRQINAGFTVAPPNAPSGAAVDNFARSFLNNIQARSFAERREYCGYFFIDADGAATSLNTTGAVESIKVNFDDAVPGEYAILLDATIN